MIEQLVLKNFTILPDGVWHFGSGLNVIIGENGVGKTHLLKLLYTLLKVQADTKVLNKTTLERAYGQKLIGVFRPERLGRLVTRKRGRERCEITLEMKSEEWNTQIAFATNAKSQVEVLRVPAYPLPASPVYFPPRELMTFYPWFISIYQNFETAFEETWCDTLILLGAPLLRGRGAEKVATMLEPLEEALGGKVESDQQTGRFYLKSPGEGRMEMPLVAEGWCKLAQLVRLISTGTLLEQGYLFWDEPEANLNPRLIKVVARSIVTLAASGVQVFLATHSLFLLRELEILLQSPSYHDVGRRWMALARRDGTVVLEQSDHVDGIQTIVALEEMLEQSDRFLSATEELVVEE